MNILWLTNVPSPYRVDFFNELGKTNDLTVLFEKKTSDERDKSWLDYRFTYFRGVFLKGKSVNTDTAICPGVIKYLSRKKYDHIVVTNISSPTGIFAIFYMRLNKIPYWIEGDGGYAKTGHGIKNHLKTFMISGAKGCFSTSKVHDDYYLSYGATLEKIYRYPFTSITQKDLAENEVLNDEEKKSLRKNLGMPEKKIILSVGRFSYKKGYGKGFDLLMRVAGTLKEGYEFYIVGDQPTQEFISWKEKEDLDNVHFISYLSKDELSKYYAAADCLVLLTRGDAWGLVINEAMVFSLPIITTPYCVAGTELVEDGVNGYLVDIDEIQVIVKRIIAVTMNDTQKRFGRVSRNKISNYTIEQMASTHISVLRET